LRSLLSCFLLSVLIPTFPSLFFFFFFFFTHTATTDIYTLSLHDALPIYLNSKCAIPFVYSSLGYGFLWNQPSTGRCELAHNRTRDRKSTRLNSSHVSISYAVFCLKKKKKIEIIIIY